MLPTYVEADISTENHHILKNFRTGRNFKDHLVEFFREQSSVDILRLSEIRLILSNRIIDLA